MASEIGGAGQGAAQGSGRCHSWADQVGATALALATLEVAVGSRRAAFPRRQLVRIHPQAHRASSQTPLRTRLGKHPVQALTLSLKPHPGLSLIHISEPTRLGMISYAVFCFKQ